MDSFDLMDSFFKYIFPILFFGGILFMPIGFYLNAKNNQAIMEKQGIHLTLLQAGMMQPPTVQVNQVHVDTTITP